MAFLSRYLTKTEQKWSLLEQAVSLVSWGLWKLRRYSTYAESIHVLVPWDEQVMIVLDKDHHVRLRALIVELGMYKVKWKVGPNRWQLGGALFQKSCNPCSEMQNEEIPRMEHHAQVLKMPAQVSLDTLDHLEDGT